MSLLAGACGKAIDPDPPVDGPADVCTVPMLTDAPGGAEQLDLRIGGRRAIVRERSQSGGG